MLCYPTTYDMFTKFGHHNSTMKACVLFFIVLSTCVVRAIDKNILQLTSYLMICKHRVQFDI